MKDKNVKKEIKSKPQTKKKIVKTKTSKKKEIVIDYNLETNLKENTIMDLFSIKINEKLKSERKNTRPQNNPYFWIVKFFILFITIVLVSFIFNSIKMIGTDIIYEINKSLRSILSGIWEFLIIFTKYILILFLIYTNVKSFRESPYYERLYKNDKQMNIYKEKLFTNILSILKICSIPFLIILLLISASSVFIFIYFLFIAMNGTTIISPFIISVSIIYISYLTYKHILYGFFDIDYKIRKNSYFLGLLLVLFGTMLVFFELRSFKYNNNLPASFETTKKVNSFDISGKDKIIIKNNSKLNNIKVYQNDNLKDEIKVYVEYYNTAKVEYVYEYNDNNDLILKFESKTAFKLKNTVDVLGVIEKGLIDKTIYNFNLFKYPNIKVYANRANADKIYIK